MVLVIMAPAWPAMGAGKKLGLLPSFDRGLVSMTFDDSFLSQYDALPILNAHNCKATMFTVTGWVGNPAAPAPPRMTLSQLHDFQNSGHEIASHTVDHQDIVTLTPVQLNAELADSKAWVLSNFGSCPDFASPEGTYNATTIAAIQQYYATQRTVDVGYNSTANWSPYILKVQNMRNTTTPAEVAGWVAQAKADKTWLIIVYHQILADTTGAPFACTPTDLNLHCQAIQDSGVPSVTTNQAMTELSPYFQQFPVAANVTGGQGKVAPATQNVDFGSDATIEITPDPGNVISSITDNGIQQPVSNPYVAANVRQARTVEVTFAQPDWFLAEGSTAWGFNTLINIENPNNTAVTARVTYMTGGGRQARPDITLPPLSQTAINPRDDIGSVDFSTSVECLENRNIAVDRRMSWPSKHGADTGDTSSIGVNAPATTWYLAEGSSNWGFECWLLVQNPNPADTNVRLTYMISGQGPKVVYHTVPAMSRSTFSMANDVGAVDASIQVDSDLPVIPERSMYTDWVPPGSGQQVRREGSCSIGTTTPATDYYLAEGSTAHGFTTYVLVENPQTMPADVVMTFMTPTGPLAPAGFKVGPQTRTTIRLNDIYPNVDLSTQVHGDVPIIAERSMYWGSPVPNSGQAMHDSIGTDAPHMEWYLPDGGTFPGGKSETFTMVQNPNGFDVQVLVTYLPRGGGNTVAFADTVAANSRKTYNMADSLTGTNASVLVQSQTPNGKVIVERSMYFNARWSGTDTIGGYSD
jgi:peptidoglycan/xylan/chitin deacetylase (PgdA/CDA1 family)